MVLRPSSRRDTNARSRILCQDPVKAKGARLKVQHEEKVQDLLVVPLIFNLLVLILTSSSSSSS